jgi:hypothetical protein
MGRTSQHYERAFEAYLIGQRIPHVMINDARRAVLPAGGVLSATDPAGTPVKIKSFDAVVYAPAASWDEPVVAGGGNLLVEVKGRRVDLRRGGSGRRESWTTMEDVRSLSAWERLFGTGFEGVLLFWYWLDGPVLNAFEPRTFRFEGRTYAHRAVRLADYTRLMRVRSPKWATVNLAGEDYERVGVPLERLFESNRGTAMGGGVAGGGIGGAGGSVAGSRAMA